MHNYFISQIISQFAEAKYILLRASDSLRGTKQSNLIATRISLVATQILVIATAVILSEVEGSPFAKHILPVAIAISLVATPVSVIATAVTLSTTEGCGRRPEGSSFAMTALSVAMATPGVSIRNSGQAIKNKT